MRRVAPNVASPSFGKCFLRWIQPLFPNVLHKRSRARIRRRLAGRFCSFAVSANRNARGIFNKRVLLHARPRASAGRSRPTGFRLKKIRSLATSSPIQCGLAWSLRHLNTRTVAQTLGHCTNSSMTSCGSARCGRVEKSWRRRLQHRPEAYIYILPFTLRTSPVM